MIGYSQATDAFGFIFNLSSIRYTASGYQLRDVSSHVSVPCFMDMKNIILGIQRVDGPREALLRSVSCNKDDRYQVLRLL
jgi:hypothetical protein